MALSDIKPLSAWSLPELLAVLGYTQSQDDAGNALYRDAEGSRLRFDENGSPILNGGNLNQGYVDSLQQAGYDQFNPYQFGEWQKKLGMSQQDALNAIYGAGSQIINDPTHGQLIQATNPYQSWQTPSLEDKSFLGQGYGSLLLMAPAVAGMAGVGAAGAGAGASDLGWAANLTDAAGGSLAAPGAAGSAYAGLGGAGVAGAAAELGPYTYTMDASGLGDAALADPTAGIGEYGNVTNSVGGLGSYVTGAGAGMGTFLDNLFKNSSMLNLAGNVIGSGINALGSNIAANTQAGAARDSNNALLSMYQQNRADLEPWRQTGINALTQLNKLTTPGSQLDMAQLDPGYAFGQAEGEKAINRSAAARGLLNSGRTIKDLIRYNQDYASTKYGDVVNRLLAMSGMGQTATNTGVAAGSNTASAMGNNLLGAGNARASGYVGMSNALTGGIGNYLNYTNQNAMLNQLLGAR